MGLTLDSFVKAAQSYEGAGFVKLHGEGAKQEAVQYGGRFLARTCGWFRKPTAEQNASVRANLLQTLAHSTEKFSDKAINAAARALGMQGDETLEIAHSALSKREVLQVIDKTRVYDRNDKYGLNDITRDEVPEEFQSLYDEVMVGSTESKADYLASKINLSRFSKADVEAKVNEFLESADGQKFAPLKKNLVDICNDSINIACSNKGKVMTVAEVQQLVADKVNARMTGKAEAYQAVLDLADPGKTDPPIAASQKEYLVNRCLRDATFSSAAYVQVLKHCLNAAEPLIQAMGKENASETEIADGIEKFHNMEQEGLRQSSLHGMGAEESIALGSDMLNLAAVKQGLHVEQGAELPASDSAKDKLVKLYTGLQYLNDVGTNLSKGIKLPDGQLAQFACVRRLKNLFARDVYHDDLTSPAQLDMATKTFARHYGASIQNLEPYGTGREAGEFGLNVDKMILHDLKESADMALDKFAKGTMPLEKCAVKCQKDTNRGYGLTLGDTVVSETGKWGMDNDVLMDALKNFFTTDGVLDEQSMVAVTSFLCQDTCAMMTMMVPLNGEGPLPQFLSTDGAFNSFEVSRNDDGSYRIDYQYENHSVESAGIQNTPQFVIMNGENGNTFKCAFSVNLKVENGKAELSTGDRSTYEYDLESAISPENARNISNKNMNEMCNPENIRKTFNAFQTKYNLGALPALTDEELAKIADVSTKRFVAFAKDEVATHEKCNQFVDYGVREVMGPKLLEMNRAARREFGSESRISDHIEDKLEGQPEYAALRDGLQQKISSKLQTVVSEAEYKLFTEDDFNEIIDTEIAKVFSQKDEMIRMVNDLSSADVPETDRLSQAKKDWFTKQICEDMSFNSMEMMSALLENQNNYIGFMTALADPGSNPADILRELTTCSSNLDSIWQENFPGEPFHGDERSFLSGSLIALAEIGLADAQGAPLDFPRANLERALQVSQELQFISETCGSQSIAQRSEGPVHGGKAAFQRLAARGGNLQFALLRRFQDLELPPYPTSLNDLSVGTKMCLIDMGLALDDYTGTAHSGKTQMSRKFVSHLQEKMDKANTAVLEKELPERQALNEVAKDLDRTGLGVTMNGTVICAPDEKIPAEITQETFVALCTPEGSDTPDMEMLRAFGGLIHQGTAADFQIELLQNAASPFMSPLSGADFSSNFDINGTPEKGFELHFSIDLKAINMPRLNDNEIMMRPQSLAEGSGWKADFTLTLTRNQEGKVELGVREPVNYEFDVRPDVQ